MTTKKIIFFFFFATYTHKRILYRGIKLFDEQDENFNILKSIRTNAWTLKQLRPQGPKIVKAPVRLQVYRPITLLVPWFVGSNARSPNKTVLVVQGRRTHRHTLVIRTVVFKQLAFNHCLKNSASTIYRRRRAHTRHEHANESERSIKSTRYVAARA